MDFGFSPNLIGLGYPYFGLSSHLLSHVRIGLILGRLTEQMGNLTILSPMRTAQEVFLPGN